MLLILAILLLVGWLLGYVAFHVTVAAIHILLAIAIILFIWHLVAGRRTTAV